MISIGKRVYTYSNPILLNPNDKLEIECVFDSTGVEQTTYWGDGTSDEMCLMTVFATLPKNIQNTSLSKYQCIYEPIYYVGRHSYMSVWVLLFPTINSSYLSTMVFLSQSTFCCTYSKRIFTYIVHLHNKRPFKR